MVKKIELKKTSSIQKPKKLFFGFFEVSLLKIISSIIGFFLLLLGTYFAWSSDSKQTKQNNLTNENTLRDRARPIQDKILEPEYNRESHKITAKKNKELEVDRITKDEFNSSDGQGNSLITMEDDNEINVYIHGASNPVQLNQTSKLKGQETTVINNGAKIIEIVDYNGLLFVATDASHKNDNLDLIIIQNLVEKSGGDFIPTQQNKGVVQIDREKYLDIFGKRKILFLFLNDNLSSKNREDIIKDIQNTFSDLSLEISSIQDYLDENKQEIRSIKSIIGDCGNSCVTYTKGSNYVPYTRKMVTKETSVYFIVPTTVEMYFEAENIIN